MEHANVANSTRGKRCSTTATLQSVARQRFYELGVCFTGPSNHLGVPIQWLNVAGEPITVALVFLQSEGNGADAIAAATATAAAHAPASPFASLQARAHQRAAEALGEGSAP